MSSGTLFNQTCYPTQHDALRAACSSLTVIAPDGSSATCVDWGGGSSTVGGGFTGTVTVKRTAASGTSTNASLSLLFSPCERYDYAYFEPLVGAFVAALVAIVAARMIYARVFNRETL